MLDFFFNLFSLFLINSESVMDLEFEREIEIESVEKIGTNRNFLGKNRNVVYIVNFDDDFLEK